MSADVQMGLKIYSILFNDHYGEAQLSNFGEKITTVKNIAECKDSRSAGMPHLP